MAIAHSDQMTMLSCSCFISSGSYITDEIAKETAIENTRFFPRLQPNFKPLLSSYFEDECMYVCTVTQKLDLNYHR